MKRPRRLLAYLNVYRPGSTTPNDQTPEVFSFPEMLDAWRGYHAREADLLFEIVDPLTGDRLPDGVYGEVVFTTLTRRGMPLIRYRTSDVSRFVPGQCPCGTSLKTLERITYRLSGRISVGAPDMTMADLDEALFSIDGVLNFTATMFHEHTRDRLDIEVQVAEDHNIPSVIQSTTDAIPRAQNFDVRVSAVKVIPANMAKRTIIDRRSHA